MVENSTKNHEKKEWEKQMKDYIVRATAANEMIRAFAVSSTGIVEEARQRHTTLPVITAALGRLLSAGAMMGAMMKGDDDIVTLGIRGDGPAQGLTVTADSHGNVKGYPFQPFVDIPRKYAGKLDVGRSNRKWNSHSKHGSWVEGTLQWTGGTSDRGDR